MKDEDGQPQAVHDGREINCRTITHERRILADGCYREALCCGRNPSGLSKSYPKSLGFSPMTAAETM